MVRFFLSTFLLGYLSACAIIPYPTAVPEEAPFSESQLESIRIGTATQDDVRGIIDARRRVAGISAIRGPREQLGGRWWIYEADRAMWGWGACIIGGVGFFGFGDCGAIDRGQRQYKLLLRFSDDDVLQEYAVVDEMNPCDRERRLCYVNDRIIRLADPEIEAAVELFEANAGQCRVHIYVDGYPDVISVFLNDERIGHLLGEEAYYHKDLESGTHRVDVEPPPLHAPSLFDCTEGELVFIRITSRDEFDSSGGPVVQRVRPRNARSVVGRRHLAVSDPDLTLSRAASTGSVATWPSGVIEARLRLFGNHYARYLAGDITESIWRVYETQLQSLFANPRVVEIYRGISGKLQPSFQDLCIELIAKIEADSVESMN